MSTRETRKGLSGRGSTHLLGQHCSVTLLKGFIVNLLRLLTALRLRRNGTAAYGGLEPLYAAHTVQ